MIYSTNVWKKIVWSIIFSLFRYFVCNIVICNVNFKAIIFHWKINCICDCKSSNFFPLKYLFNYRVHKIDTNLEKEFEYWIYSKKSIDIHYIYCFFFMICYKNDKSYVQILFTELINYCSNRTKFLYFFITNCKITWQKQKQMQILNLSQNSYT